MQVTDSERLKICRRLLERLLNSEFGNFPLLPEEGWTRHQEIIAKHPLWSGRGGDPIPPSVFNTYCDGKNGE
jgi:hypothetical protein